MSLIDDTTFTPKSDCPKCGHFIDAATPTLGIKAKPSEGDLSVCIQCGQILVFSSDLTTRKITALETLQLQTNYPERYQQLMHISKVHDSLMKKRGFGRP